MKMDDFDQRAVLEGLPRRGSAGKRAHESARESRKHKNTPEERPRLAPVLSKEEGVRFARCVKQHGLTTASQQLFFCGSVQGDLFRTALGERPPTGRSNRAAFFEIAVVESSMLMVQPSCTKQKTWIRGYSPPPNPSIFVGQ